MCQSLNNKRQQNYYLGIPPWFCPVFLYDFDNYHKQPNQNEKASILNKQNNAFLHTMGKFGSWGGDFSSEGDFIRFYSLCLKMNDFKFFFANHLIENSVEDAFFFFEELLCLKEWIENPIFIYWNFLYFFFFFARGNLLHYQTCPNCIQIKHWNAFEWKIYNVFTFNHK